MSINSYFNDFLSNIRLTPDQVSSLKTGHTTLRNRLNADPDLSAIVISTFLQGSYRRATAVRPQGEKRADVDIIVVTNLNRNSITPHDAIDKFVPFVERHYKGKYEIQGRSIGIELSYVDLDIVITSAPSEETKAILKSVSVTTEQNLEELNDDWKLVTQWDKIQGRGMLNEAVRNAAEWKTEPLFIPDRDANTWEQTHPLEQIRWTRDKNKNTNKHYINVVKALKWWRILKLTDLQYPKGYPIEHMIGDCCPDNIVSVSQGVCMTLEKIVSEYKIERTFNTTPTLPDRGVPEHNVWKRISAKEFATFYDHVVHYAKIAREAMDATSLKTQVEKWQELFGSKFPSYDGDDDSGSNLNNSNGPTGGFTQRNNPSTISGGRFA